ncbi:MAG: hypothetical protein K2P78_02120 [Gemmataceae bacterium]|nr:hypothetical protein [Gemmataceae bacterium]
MSSTQFRVNLGGEGEVPGVLNQQPPGAAGPAWFTRSGLSLIGLILSGVPVLVCANDDLTLPDGCADIVYTNHVPIDQVSTLGPGVQSSEIERILKAGGVWVRDGVPYYTKP